MTDKYIKEFNEYLRNPLKSDEKLLTFTFRAECFDDLHNLRKLMHEKGSFHKVTTVLGDVYPDVLCLMLTNCDFDALMDHMRNVSDGHVMVQTLSNDSKDTASFKEDPFLFWLERDYEKI